MLIINKCILIMYLVQILSYDLQVSVFVNFARGPTEKAAETCGLFNLGSDGSGHGGAVFRLVKANHEEHGRAKHQIVPEFKTNEAQNKRSRDKGNPDQTVHS